MKHYRTMLRDERMDIINVTRRSIFAVLLMTAPVMTALSFTAAHAQEIRIVSAHGLDLTNPTDVKRLQRRVNAAVRTVCGDASLSDLHTFMVVERCRRAAAEGATLQIASLVRRNQERATAEMLKKRGQG